MDTERVNADAPAAARHASAVVIRASGAGAGADRKVGAPEWWERHARRCEDQGAPLSEVMAYAALAVRARERACDVRLHDIGNVATFFAAALRCSRRAARGCHRWMARHYLARWLPHLPDAQRAEVLDVLAGCSAGALGRELADVVAVQRIRSSAVTAELA